MYVYMKTEIKSNSNQTISVESRAMAGASYCFDGSSKPVQNASVHDVLFVTTSSLESPTKLELNSTATQPSNVTNVTSDSVVTGMPEMRSPRPNVLSESDVEKNRGRETMKTVTRNILVVAIIATQALSSLVAQGLPKLDIKITDQKINLTAAEKKAGAVVNYLPGDTLKYVIVASNSGDGLMTEPEIVDPIPAGVTYIAESAIGEASEITFSMNQGSTYMAWPPVYTVRNSKGILIKRKATPEMISHIRWNITKSMKPGEAVTLEFLVEVNK